MKDKNKSVFCYWRDNPSICAQGVSTEDAKRKLILAVRGYYDPINNANEAIDRILPSEEVERRIKKLDAVFPQLNSKGDKYVEL